MNYLLDTNICIFLFKNQCGIKEKILSLSEADKLFVSEATIAELYYGAAKSNHVELEYHNIELLYSLCTVLPISSSLKTYGHCKAILEKAGQRIDDMDLLIGCSAVEHQLIIVTENVKHMSRIPGSICQNWVVR